MAETAPFDLEEQRAFIERAQEETRTFVAGQHKLIAEQSKVAAEQSRLAAEASKLVGDRGLAPWQIARSGMAAGAAFFGAGAAFLKVLGS